MSPHLPLSTTEARVLAVLVEKQHTVPDSYPLSLNALTLGCNQKTAREPVLSLSEDEVLHALDALKARHLVGEVSGSRVLRFEHNAARVLGVRSQGLALLTLLMLRGPQTPAELRLHTERLHRFADVASVEGFLDDLAAMDPPLAVRLPRAPGAREARWAHLLCGAAVLAPTAAAPGGEASNGEHSPQLHQALQALEALQGEQAALRAELQDLRNLVQHLAAELGVELPSASPPVA